MLHAVRDTLVGQRTQAMNALRGHFGEIGIVVATGPKHVAELVARVMRAAAVASTPPAAPDAAPQEVAKIEQRQEEAALPRHMLIAMQALVSTLTNLNADIEELDRAINAALKENELALKACHHSRHWLLHCHTAQPELYPTAEGYTNARAFAASPGLVPAQHSTGGKAKLRGISKMGNRDVRRLLVVGASCSKPSLSGRVERGLGQQARPHRLGVDRAGRDLQRRSPPGRSGRGSGGMSA